MNKLATTFISALTVLALAGPLYAADQQQMQTESSPTGQSLTAVKYEGMQVVNQKGEKVGKITDAHADRESGQIQYVTVSRDDAARDKVAVPLEALQFDQQNRRATLKVDENKLASAPKKGDTPMQEFLFQLEDHYGVAPAWQDKANIMGPPVPPGDVPGQQIKSRQ